MAHSGFGRRTNHSGQFSKLSPIGDSRRAMGDTALARPTTGHGRPARMSAIHAETSLTPFILVAGVSPL